ncbi:hypothetical protein [Micromonospora chersina]|uniref:hypothetical protein n=1 Tax=Micromonospora chersina TaxID=47854 RepID=UPI00371AB9D2
MMDLLASEERGFGGFAAKAATGNPQGKPYPKRRWLDSWWIASVKSRHVPAEVFIIRSTIARADPSSGKS